MNKLRGAKFTHFLAEFLKSIQASDSTVRGRPFDLILHFTADFAEFS